MVWQVSDEQNWRVVESSLWLNIEDYKQLQPRTGVYIFASAIFDVKYVGKAGAGRMIDEIADAIRRGKNLGASIVKALYTNSDEDAIAFEGYLIEKYQPPNNETGKAFWQQ